jgi:hypothetical protein
VTCPHSRDFLLAGRFDFIAGYLARGSISEGERRGSVLLAALLVLTRRLLSAGRGPRGMGEWKRANLRRGPRGSSVAPGGARSLQGSSGGARSPPGELDRSALCGFLARGGGVARRCGVPLRSVTPLHAPSRGPLMSLYINFFSRFLLIHRSGFPVYQVLCSADASISAK